MCFLSAKCEDDIWCTVAPSGERKCMLSRCRSNQAAAGQRQHLSEAEKPRNCSCGARSSAVSSCQSSAPRCRTGPNPGHVRPFFYVTGPAEPIYLHKSSSNATRVDPVFTTVTSMHDAWQYGDGGLYLAGGSQTIAALSRNLRLSVSSAASPL